MSLQLADDGITLYHFSRTIEQVSLATSNINDLVFLKDIISAFPGIKKHIAEHVFNEADNSENLILWSTVFATGLGNYSPYDLMCYLVKSAKFTLVNRYERSMVDPDGSHTIPFEKHVEKLMEKVTSNTGEL